MPEESNIQKLKVARSKVADVYRSEAIDELHDNGNLSTMNNAILAIEKVIETLEARANPE